MLAEPYTYAEDGLDELAPLLGMDTDSMTTGRKERDTAALYFRKAARTPSFDTAFKHLYAEKLAPYGFQKIKGKRPYFVRMEGDEIAHVIAYVNRSAFRPYKSFIITWGWQRFTAKKLIWWRLRWMQAG